MLPEKILVVEDELIVNLNLQDIFSELGILISDYVDTAEKALRLLGNKTYDLIIMDINIKGPVDGIRLSKEIVKKYKIPIVFMTSYYDAETIEQASEVSPYGYITKPFTPVDIKLALTVAHGLCKREKRETVPLQETDRVFINRDYTYFREEEVLYYKDKALRLSKYQTKLLNILIRNINHTVSAETLTYEIWGDTDIAESSLRTLIYSFRKKYPDIPIHNNGWRGYSLQKSEER